MDLENTVWVLRALIVTELVTDSRLLEWIELEKQLFKFRKWVYTGIISPKLRSKSFSLTSLFLYYISYALKILVLNDK